MPCNICENARPLNEAPGLLLDESAREDALVLLALLVERRWTGHFYAASGTTFLRIVEGDRAYVHTKDPEAERLVRYRLVMSGGDVPPI
jgi:hypothetical protein